MDYNPTTRVYSDHTLSPDGYERIVRDCKTLVGALGYDMNTVEWAIKDDVPYAIDFMNPAPDMDVNSLGLPRHRRRRQLREVLNRQHVGPAGAGIAARLVPVVLREEHDTLEIGEPHEQLKGRGADVPVVLGALVAPSVISETTERHH